MKLTLKLKIVDSEETTLTALVPDFIAWERYTKRPISELADGMGMEDMAYMAYCVLRRSGANLKPFDLWINSLESVDPVAENPKATR